MIYEQNKPFRSASYFLSMRIQIILNCLLLLLWPLKRKDSRVFWIIFCSFYLPRSLREVGGDGTRPSFRYAKCYWKISYPTRLSAFFRRRSHVEDSNNGFSFSEDRFLTTRRGPYCPFYQYQGRYVGTVPLPYLPKYPSTVLPVPK